MSAGIRPAAERVAFFGCRRKASPNPEVKPIIEESRQKAGLIKAGLSVSAWGPQARAFRGFCIVVRHGRPADSTLTAVLERVNDGRHDHVKLL